MIRRTFENLSGPPQTMVCAGNLIILQHSGLSNTEADHRRDLPTEAGVFRFFWFKTDVKSTEQNGVCVGGGII